MRWLSLIFLGLLPLSVDAAALRQLRLWESPESTRLVFELEGAVTHKLFTLSNPERIVIDISGVDKDGAKLANQIAGKGLVQRVRSGPRDDGSLRVVLDVSESVLPKSFVLEPTENYGFRLVLDLYGTPKLQVTPDSMTLAEAPQLAIPAPVQANALPPPPSAPAITLGETPGPKPAPPVRAGAKPIVIAVDAGHGGEDPGAIGRSGLREKDVALAMARKLVKQINAEPGYVGMLTRDGDYYVAHRERMNRARKADADLFVSIHANAYKDRNLRGSAVYVLSDRGATSEHARWLAHKENAADMVGGIGLHDKDNELAAVLIDLSQASTMEASFDIGGRLLESLSGVHRLQKAEVQQAGFLVLKSPDIPSVLVETAFITNKEDEKLLGSQGFQDKLVRSLMKGIKGYFSSYRPQQQIVQEPRQQKVRMQGEAPARTLEVSYSAGTGSAVSAP